MIRAMIRYKDENEVREEFVHHVKNLVDYWDKCETTQDRLGGLAFSILSTIDGCSMAIPGFILAPLPHPEDKQYHLECGDKYCYAENHNSNVVCDIAGSLHDTFSRIR